MRRFALLAAGLAAALAVPAVAAPAPAPGPAAACRAGANGGATAPGVTADRIRLLVPHTGDPVSNLLRLVDQPPAYVGMEAALRRVNESGGICGRSIQLVALDDEGDPRKLAELTRDTLAVAVAPGSAAVRTAIADGTVRRLRVPVVGRTATDVREFRDPYAWPVAAPTVAQMRAMARYAYDRGARSFALVGEDRYPGGAEGAAAFADYVRTLRGATLTSWVTLPSSGSDPAITDGAQRVARDCGPSRCDAVAVMLGTGNALKFFRSQPDQTRPAGRLVTSGPEALLDADFAGACGAPCAGMLVWGGYHLPLGAADPAVRQYVEDVRAVDPETDPADLAVASSYAGTALVVEALRRAGPNLTRERLQAVLAGAPFRIGLTEPLHFGRARCGNTWLRAYRVEGGGLTAAGGAVRDPRPCAFPGVA